MSRLETLQQRMEAEGVDAVALTPGAHLQWLFGLTPIRDERPFVALITQTDAGFLVPELEAEALSNRLNLATFAWADSAGPASALTALIKSVGLNNQVQTFALDESMRADHAALIQDAFPSAQRHFSASTLGALRMLKTSEEVAALKHNAIVADRAMQTAWEQIVPGMREGELAEIINQAFIANEATPLFSIVAAGANSAMPHYNGSDCLLADGQALLIDIGGSMLSYSSDITRMAVIGNEPEGYDEIHSIVEAALTAALASAKPGIRACEVDKAARDVITQAGYGEYFMHRTGHGLGQEVHEPPYITATSQTLLEEGMVFSIEPGIYLPGKFGVRLEEIVSLRADGPEILSNLSRSARHILL